MVPLDSYEGCQKPPQQSASFEGREESSDLTLQYKHRLISTFNSTGLMTRAFFSNHWDKKGNLVPEAPKCMKQLADYKLSPSALAVTAGELRTSEPEYQSGPQQPRPVSSLMAGVPTNFCHTEFWHYDMRVLVDVQGTIAFYKWDACTNTNKFDDPPELQLYGMMLKANHGLEAHTEKRREMARRWSSLYPNCSEGHFNEKGAHTGFHWRSRSKTAEMLFTAVPWLEKPNDLFDVRYLPWDEITTTGYRPENYLAIVADQINMLCPWQPLYWVEFHGKYRHDGLPLPLVYYDIDRCDITVFTPDEYPHLFNGEYAQAVVHLNRLMRLYSISRNTLGILLFKLPPAEAVRLVVDNGEEYKQLAEHLDKPETEAFLGLKYGHLTTSELKQALSNVSDPNQQFQMNGKKESLLPLIFDYSTNGVVLKRSPYINAELTPAPPANTDLTFADIKRRSSSIGPLTRGWVLGRKLIEKGLDVKAIEITNQQIQQNPLLAAELYIAGAQLDDPARTLLPVMAAQLHLDAPDAIVQNVFDRLILHLHDNGQAHMIQEGMNNVKRLYEEYKPSDSDRVAVSLSLISDWLDNGHCCHKRTPHPDTIEPKAVFADYCRNFCALLEEAFHCPKTVKSLRLTPGKIPEPAEPIILEPFEKRLARDIIDLHKSLPMEFAPLEDVERNAQVILQRYYLMPSQKQMEKSLTEDTLEWNWRSFHGADHVVRTAMNVEWLTELFHKHGLDQGHLSPKACQMLQHAALYHDITAEVEDKALEEVNAAQAMMDDMFQMMQTDDDKALFMDVVSALRNKNVNDMKGDLEPPFTPDVPGTRERLFRQILRMADSIEITRCATVKDNITETPDSKASFSLQYSDAPDVLETNPAFREELVASVENMMDLAFTTGGRCVDDQRKAKNFGFRFGLRNSVKANAKRQLVMNLDTNVCQRIRHEQELVIARQLAAALHLHGFYDSVNGTDVDLIPVIHNDEHLEEFFALVKPLIDGMTPLQRQTFTLPENWEPLVEAARRRVPPGWTPTLRLGTLSQIDLQHSAALREELRKRELKVIQVTYDLPDGPHSLLRVVNIQSPEAEAPLLPEAEGIAKKQALTQKRAELVKKVKEKAGK